MVHIINVLTFKQGNSIVQVGYDQSVSLSYSRASQFTYLRSKTIRNTILSVVSTWYIALSILLNHVIVSKATYTKCLTFNLVIEILVTSRQGLPIDFFQSLKNLIGIQNPLVVNSPIAIVITTGLIHMVLPCSITRPPVTCSMTSNVIGSPVTGEHETRKTTETLVTRFLGYHFSVDTVQSQVDTVDCLCHHHIRHLIGRNGLQIIVATAHQSYCRQNN